MSAIACSTVLSPTDADFSVSTSADRDDAAAPTISLASVWNSSFFATKSVSQLSSISAPSLAATRPSAVERSARLPTSFAPLMRNNSTALSKSPPLSLNAFLQSSMPAPVNSRSRLTSAAVKFAMSAFRCLRFGGRRIPISGGVLGSVGGFSGCAGEQFLLPLCERLGRLGVGLVTVAQPGTGLQALGDRSGDNLRQQRG